MKDFKNKLNRKQKQILLKTTTVNKLIIQF
jgi:hypothetical protein